MTPTENPISGQCLCGAVHFAASATTNVSHCHCRACRRHSGAAFQTWIGVPKTSFAVTGPLKSFRSSEHATRLFCETCGSLIAMEYHGDSEMSLTLGSLDDPSGITASRHIWTSERLDLVGCVDPDIPSAPHQD